MTITTSAFLCSVVDAPSPYRRKVGAALLAASSSRYWTRMIDRVRRTADLAIHRMLDASPDFTTGSASASQVLGAGDLASSETSLMPLIVDTTFALVHTLPEGRLTGELSDSAIRTMMIADHLAFGAMERVPSHEPDAIRALATRLQLAALDNSSHQ